MKIINTKDNNFNEQFETILARAKSDIKGVSSIVMNIIDEIVVEGNTALKRHIEKFDKWEVKSDEDLMIDPTDMKKAYDNIDEKLRNALHIAYDRIKKYHEKQLPKSWLDFESNGTILGQKVSAVDRAGLYIPGGKAAYPSSLLMNAIPAIVAGVEEIVVCTPTPDNEVNELLLAACHLCGIKKAYKVGGASAIAAMAYGTQTIPKVDVITGPGNIFVATAKKLVFGEVNIDMIAGPSEILVVADENANPEYVAADLLSQAEHDPMASAILLTTSEDLLNSVNQQLSKQSAILPKKEIVEQSLKNYGKAIVCDSLEECISISNEIAPEHLELMISNPMEYLQEVKNAGSVFLGYYTCESIGDYFGGTNHVLPTSGTARFSSALSVDSFIKKSSYLYYSKQAIEAYAKYIETIASEECLQAHANAAKVRVK